MDIGELMTQEAARMQDHLLRYLKDGENGHLFDTRHLGGRVDTTTLILKTVGRKSGKTVMTPLIYVKYGDEYAIAASKGGADEHPAWYLNLVERPEVILKIVNECYAASWREPVREERAIVWKKLVEHYRPYEEYKSKAKRNIPVILLKPEKTITNF